MERCSIIFIMAVFYSAYAVKKMQQRKHGITTMLLGKGDKPAKQRRIEVWLKVSTFLIPFVELASIWYNLMDVPRIVKWIGIAIAALGVLIFIVGMLTMSDSWRAGIPDKKETSLVTSGIFRYSRNPAFVGFDLMYIGILVAYPNIWHAAAVILVVYLFHQQIRNEETFMEEAFGEEYLEYKKRVRRYF